MLCVVCFFEGLGDATHDRLEGSGHEVDGAIGIHHGVFKEVAAILWALLDSCQRAGVGVAHGE